MCDLIHYQNEAGLALIGLAASPSNTLGQPLREAMLAAFERAAADAQVQAIILHGVNGSFSAGADIHELNTPARFARPELSTLLLFLKQLDKPVVAAIEGVALGEGLELAMACGYRIASHQALLGLPDIKLGLIGGTQRLARLIGAEPALQLALSGELISTEKGLQLGVLDQRLDAGDHLLDAARRFARQLLEHQAPAHPADPFSDPGRDLPEHFFSDYRARQAPRWKGQQAPQWVVSAIEAACSLPLNEGLAVEQSLLKRAEASAQSAALRHVFFAEREVGNLPGIDANTATRPVNTVAVIGAGTMGAGIAMCFANAGMPVTLLELKAEALERGLGHIRKQYETRVKRGRITPAQLEQRMALICGSLSYTDLADVDLVIEAVFESLSIKQQVFETLDAICKPGAILASNTSTLNVDAIAAVTQRPQDVVGLHFFSPANVMRLLEVVRGRKTAAQVLATLLNVATRIGKLAVVSGVCFGFIGNRMLEPYSREAHRLLLEGASPAQVDKVLTDLGLAMGVLTMTDLAGVDVGFLVRESRRESIAHDRSYCIVSDALFGLGRYGQKTTRGFYRYEGRDRLEDSEVVELAARLAHELGIERRVISDQEIHDRCLFMLINEGIQLLDEGIAQRSSDIDLVWINGYGFPAWRGGPLHYAESLGLRKVLIGIQHYRQTLGAYGALWFQPAALLERLVAQQKNRIATA